MKNCLSKSKFANLLFVNVKIEGGETIALFDTGAGMSVIAKSLAEKLGTVAENETVNAGNNSGVVRSLPTAVVTNVRFGDVRIDELKVIVTDDADFAFTDECGTDFPAQMLLGWDVISRYCWEYSAKDETLSVGESIKTSASDAVAEQSPIVFPEYVGHRFKAALDTGHTESTLSAVWRNRLPKVEHHEAEVVGVGSIERVLVPYAECLELAFQNHIICLRNVDICESIPGRSADIEALLGYDFLEGLDWRLNGELQLL